MDTNGQSDLVLINFWFMGVH